MSDIEQKSLEIARKLFAEGKSSAEAFAVIKQLFEEDQKAKNQAAADTLLKTGSEG